MSMDYGLEPGGSPTPRGPSNEQVLERAEELADDWLGDPQNLWDIATSGGATACDIWPILADAIAHCAMRGENDIAITVHRIRGIRLMLIAAAAPRFMEQARSEWRNRETNDD